MDYKHKFKYKNVLKAIGNLLNIIPKKADSKLRDPETSRKFFCLSDV